MKEILDVIHNTIYQFFDVCEDNEEAPMSDKDKLLLDVNKAICNNLKALESESRMNLVQEAVNAILNTCNTDSIADKAMRNAAKFVQNAIDGSYPDFEKLEIGCCKDCKYFEYDSVAKVDGIPLIVAHEICKRWGDGCKSKEDGYCFLFEPKMQEVEE